MMGGSRGLMVLMVLMGVMVLAMPCLMDGCWFWCLNAFETVPALYFDWLPLVDGWLVWKVDFFRFWLLALIVWSAGCIDDGLVLR